MDYRIKSGNDGRGLGYALYKSEAPIGGGAGDGHAVSGGGKKDSGVCRGGERSE
jgi:hypothetical protein